MVSQSVILDLDAGDRVQVYMFTNTGLLDKPGNPLSHFVGIFLRPKDFLVRGDSDAVVTNGTSAIPLLANGHSK